MNIVDITKKNFEKCKKNNINSQSIKYFYNPLFEINKYRKYENTKIDVVNSDTLDLALSLSKNTLLLNMANPIKIGGNLNIIGSQEEDLFRRTDLCLHLTQDYYPLNSTLVILSKNVKVFSKGLRHNFEELKEIRSE